MKSIKIAKNRGPPSKKALSRFTKAPTSGGITDASIFSPER